MGKGSSWSTGQNRLEQDGGVWLVLGTDGGIPAGAGTATGDL